jgi:hypothetical protein
MASPHGRVDPVALAILGLAGLLAIGIATWLVVALQQQPAAPAQEGIAEVAKRVIDQFRDPPKPAPQPSRLPPVAKRESAQLKPKAEQSAASATPTLPTIARAGIDLPAGKSWTYAVRLEPEVWRNAELVYRSSAGQGGIVVDTDFRHAGGNVSFRLGTYRPGHASHANVRFPGFFMHGAYLDFPLEAGKRFSWTYPWQQADNRVRADRVRRFDAVVGPTETVSVPAGRFEAIRVDITLSYVDAGSTLATVNEILWYAPSARQIVKLMRAGDSPDEAGKRIVADLAGIS